MEKKGVTTWDLDWDEEMEKTTATFYITGSMY